MKEYQERMIGVIKRAVARVPAEVPERAGIDHLMKVVPFAAAHLPGSEEPGYDDGRTITDLEWVGGVNDGLRAVVDAVRATRYDRSKAEGADDASCHFHSELEAVWEYDKQVKDLLLAMYGMQGHIAPDEDDD